MHQQKPKSKATPTRRRNRRSANSPATKTYASENDVPWEPAFPVEYNNVGPYTPLKSTSNSPAPAAQAANSKSKPRSNGGNHTRARPKQASTSPGPARQGHKTPPNNGIPRPSAAPAFAGATFHASPAPSSLPIPSFLARALDSPGLNHADHASQEPSPPATDSEAPTPQRTSSNSRSAMDESPLDFFFRADRAEKERAHRTSDPKPSTIATKSLSPPHHGAQSPPGTEPVRHKPFILPRPALRSPPGSEPTRNNTTLLPRRGPFQRASSLGISASELDGTPGKPMGPAFSTPFQERIKAARSSENHALTTPPRRQKTPSTSNDRGEALKQFLALGPSTPSGSAHAGHPPIRPPPNSCRSPFNGMAWPQIQQTAASSPAGSDRNRSRNLLEMEDSLRRILKLNPESNL